MEETTERLAKDEVAAVLDRAAKRLAELKAERVRFVLPKAVTSTAPHATREIRLDKLECR